MLPTDDAPIPELTPEEKAKVLAHFAKQFTVEKLIEYVEDDVEKMPFERVLAEVEEMVRAAREPSAAEAA